VQKFSKFAKICGVPKIFGGDLTPILSQPGSLNIENRKKMAKNWSKMGSEFVTEFRRKFFGIPASLPKGPFFWGPQFSPIFFDFFVKKCLRGPAD
jgi:hypothetical protein